MNRNPHRRTKGSPVYEATTRGVVVRVVTTYLPAQSSPEESRYSWAYMIEIENHGEEPVQLVSRRWEITDAMNRTEVVTGAGVVGEQPHLKPRPPARCAEATTWSPTRAMRSTSRSPPSRCTCPPHARR
jgi:ApaG protein